MIDPASGGWRVFRHRDFRFFVGGRFLTAIGQHAQTIGVGLYVYELTRDPLALGLAGLLTFLPQLLLVVLSGHVADTYDRRLISALTFALNALSAALLLAIVVFGATSMPLIYGAIMLVGVARVFGMPANQAMLPNLVTSAELPVAIAWSASVFQAATILGPAVGGLLYIAGPTVVFAAATLLHLFAALSMWLIRAQSPPEGATEFRWDSVFVGLRFIAAQPALLGAISLDLVAVLFGGVGALLPIFATDILDAGPTGLGLLRSSQAAGALGVALFLAQFPIRSHAGRWILTAVALYGLAIIGFGLSKLLWLSMLLMALEGAADMVSVVVRLSIMQRETPDEMRGRVASVNTLFISASNSLGEFEAGGAAALMGTVPATLFGGAMAILTALSWAVLFPQLRRRQTL